MHDCSNESMKSPPLKKSKLFNFLFENEEISKSNVTTTKVNVEMINYSNDSLLTEMLILWYFRDQMQANFESYQLLY